MTFAASLLAAHLAAARAAHAQTVVPSTDVLGNAVVSQTVLPATSGGTGVFQALTQNNAQWCFATSAAMVLQYFGATVPECELVDQCRVVDGVTTCGNDNNAGCCPGGASNSTCDTAGGDSHTILEFYGVHSVFADLAVAQIGDEIAAGRPVVTGFDGTWGGHVLVISGVGKNSLGQPLLLIDDPAADQFSTMPAGAYGNSAWGDGNHGDVCPESENPCWITWEQYQCACDSNGSGACGCGPNGTNCFGGHSAACAGAPHTVQEEAYQIAPVAPAPPVCTTDFFDFSATAVGNCNYWAEQGGNSVVALTATLVDGGAAVGYSASYQYPYGAPVNHMQVGLSPAAYQSWLGSESASSYRPTQTSVVYAGGQWQLSGITEPLQPGEKSAISNNAMLMTETPSFTTLNGSVYTPQAGYVLADLYVYNQPGTPGYLLSATWVQMTASVQQAPVATFTPAAEFQSVFNENFAAGLRPTRISAYTTDSAGDVSYAALWVPDGGASWYLYVGLSPGALSALNLSMYSSGYTLSYLSALDDSYSAIWTYTDP